MIAIATERFTVLLYLFYDNGVWVHDLFKVHAEVKHLGVLFIIIMAVMIHAAFFVLPESAEVLMLPVEIVPPIHLHILTTINHGVAFQTIVHHPLWNVTRAIRIYFVISVAPHFSLLQHLTLWNCCINNQATD